MSQIAGLVDFSRQGPPADIGTFVLPASAVVFPFTFSGTTYYAAIRAGVRGWVLLSYGTVPETVVNAAFTALGAGAKVVLIDATYALQAAGISLTANSQVLEGQGRGTFIDGDALATGVHAINISGLTDCVVRNLSVQTEDGGGKTCHCVFIEDGADRFRVENVWVVDSDRDGIHVEGTSISGGSILNCAILDADNNGIYCDPDGGNSFDYFHVSGCTVTDAGNYGILFFATLQYSTITENISCNNGWEGILVTGHRVTCEANVCFNNVRHGMYCYQSFNSAFVGNICYSNGWHGILTDDCYRCTVSSNVCTFNDSGDTASYDGICLGAAYQDNVVVGNLCYGNHRYGISAPYWLGRCTIVGNTCTMNDRHGIYSDASDCIVEANHLYDNGQDAPGTYHGIYLHSNADRSIIKGNLCSSPGDSQEDGINLGLAASEILVIGNFCYNGMGSGIHLTLGVDDCAILNNYCLNNDDYGIRIADASCDRNLVKNNVLRGNTLGAILDNGTDTRLPEIFMPVTDPDGTIGEHPCIVLTDGADTTLRFQIPTPMEFQELVRARVLIVAGGSGDMQWSTVTNYGRVCTTDHYNARSDAETDQTTAVLINDMSCIPVNASLDGLLAGDLVGFRFIRRATQPGDTVDADCYFLGFRLQYV